MWVLRWAMTALGWFLLVQWGGHEFGLWQIKHEFDAGEWVALGGLLAIFWGRLLAVENRLDGK